MTRKRNYINNREFFQALVDYQKLCSNCKEGEPLPKIPNYIGQCIFAISNRLSNKPNFSGYTYKEEMISDSIENALNSVLKFNSEKSDNPFSYFTTIIINAFIRRIAREQRETYTIYKAAEQQLLEANLNDNNFSSELASSGIYAMDSEYIQEFVIDYERKIEDKKEKLKEKKREKEEALNQ